MLPYIAASIHGSYGIWNVIWIIKCTDILYDTDILLYSLVILLQTETCFFFYSCEFLFSVYKGYCKECASGPLWNLVVGHSWTVSLSKHKHVCVYLNHGTRWSSHSFRTRSAPWQPHEDSSCEVVSLSILEYFFSLGLCLLVGIVLVYHDLVCSKPSSFLLFCMTLYDFGAYPLVI